MQEPCLPNSRKWWSFKTQMTAQKLMLKQTIIRRSCLKSMLNSVPKYMQSWNEQLPHWGSIQAQIPALFSHLFPIWPALFCRHLLGEEPGNTFWVAINCVEEPWEGEAEDGSQEEQANHHFLLHRCYEGHVWPEHVEDAQTKEEHASWKTARHRGVRFMHTESFSF